jgi:tryptophan halogenase
MGDEELRGFLDNIRNRVRRTVSQLPSHQDYVRGYCPAKP